MRPLTDTVHKTLMSVNGKTLIEWMIDALIGHHITDITLVTGYLADDLTTFLNKAYPQLSIRYIHNSRYAETNNIFSMALAMEHLTIDSDLVLIECDLIFDSAVLQRLLDAPHANVALVDRYRAGLDGTVVTLGEGDRVTSVIPPHLQDETFDFSDKYKTLNIYRFSQAFCQGDFQKIISYYARTIDSNAYYELMLGILIYLQRNVIHAVVLQGEPWAEIDDANDLAVARFLFEPQQRQQILAAAHGGFWNYDILDFCYLRNMHFPTGAVLSELRNGLVDALHNYGSAQAVLDLKLSYFLRCNPAHVTVLNGAAQVFPYLSQQFSPPQVLMPTPTFGEYARVFPGAQTYEDQGQMDWDAIAQRLSPGMLLVIVNPNNPTGTTLPTSEIYQFAFNHPQVTLCVDESFIDFSDQESIQTRLEKQPLSNVFIVKSLSKSLGVPGMRLGYLYCTDPVFHTKLKAALPIWNLNSVAEHFLELLLKHRPAVEASFCRTQQDRAAFIQQLKAMDWVEAVYPSGGNFVLVACRCSPVALGKLTQAAIAQHGIYLKDVSSRFSDGRAYLRFAVRLPTEHQRLLACLNALIDS